MPCLKLSLWLALAVYFEKTDDLFASWGPHALLLKARTTPKEGPMIISLGWPESAGLDPGCATADIPLKPADGSARTTSPAPPQARQRRIQFLLGLTGSQNVFASSGCWIRPGVVSSCNLWLFPWDADSFSFLSHWILGEQEVAGGLPTCCEFLWEGLFCFQFYPWKQESEPKVNQG